MPAERTVETIPPHELAAACHKHAAKWNVSAAVHPQDFIFQFILKHQGFSDPDAAVRYYFDDGRRSAERLKSILESDLSVNVAVRKKLLEFASGYGAVTRHLTVVFPALEITSSDIHPDANNFIVNELHGKAIPSSVFPECFDAAGEYDVVFALSFFSHLPAATWSRWLSALFKALRVGGNLIFTTHGPTSLRTIPVEVSLDRDGFYFSPESEQDDLDKDQYGTTFTSSRFVVGHLEALENCEIRLIRAGFWWGHQDLYVASKVAGAVLRPIPDRGVYRQDGRVAGNVERISVDEKPVIAPGVRTLRVAGWVAPDVEGAEPADRIILLFRAGEGTQFSCAAVREDRHDVARVLKNPALVRTGYRATVDISRLEGDVTMLLAVQSGPECRLCPTVSIPLP